MNIRNNILVGLLVLHEITGVVAGKPDLFDCVKYDKTSTIAWINGGDENLLVALPFELAKSVSMSERISAARLVASHGNYLDYAEVETEIADGMQQGNFAPLFGWTNAVANLEYSPILARFLSKKCAEEKNVHVLYVLCYCIDVITETVDGPNPFGLRLFTEKDAAEIRQNLRKMKDNVKMAKMKDHGYRDYLIARLAKL